jgi:hypothetical protein
MIWSRSPSASKGQDRQLAVRLREAALSLLAWELDSGTVAQVGK